VRLGLNPVRDILAELRSIREILEDGEEEEEDQDED